MPSAIINVIITIQILLMSVWVLLSDMMLEQFANIWIDKPVQHICNESEKQHLSRQITYEGKRRNNVIGYADYEIKKF